MENSQGGFLHWHEGAIRQPLEAILETFGESWSRIENNVQKNKKYKEKEQQEEEEE